MINGGLWETLRPNSGPEEGSPDGRAAVPEVGLVPDPPFVMAFPAPLAVERTSSVVNITMVVDSWEFVPEAGTMVVIVTWCTNSLVEVIPATGR